MKMQALVARQNLSYGGKLRKIGSTFQAPAHHAKLLVLLKRAQYDPAGTPIEVAEPKEPQPSPLQVIEEATGYAPPAPRRRGRPPTKQAQR